MNMNGTVTVERMSAVSVDIIKGLQYVSVAGAFIQSIREIWIWKTETIEEEFSAYMIGGGSMENILKRLVRSELEVVYLIVDQLHLEELVYLSEQLDCIKKELKSRVRTKFNS